MKTIKWGMIQPLTGGMYIGARKAIGHAADWIISYPGLTTVKHDKNNNITSVGNEYHLLDWCKRNNELPNYKIINRKPFDSNMNTNVDFLQDEIWSTDKDIDFTGTDIVFSVPVCSGLSQATIASDETKDSRNCNMLWNLRFAVERVKPLIYIFENAPALYSDTGKHVRQQIDEIATEYSYSVIYYKTDTKYHDNCQRRPRTFVILVKYRNDEVGAPDMNKEYVRVGIKDFFNRISQNATQQECIDLDPAYNIILDFVRNHYGEYYRDIIGTKSIIDAIDKENLWKQLYDFIDSCDYSIEAKTKLTSICDRIQRKKSQGKNYYSLIPTWIAPMDETIRACMFKSIQKLMHWDEDRLLTIREWLHTMGMPEDFILHGDINENYAKIGQNVPARTAQFIASEAVRIINDWSTIERNNQAVHFIDNTKHVEIVK